MYTEGYDQWVKINKNFAMPISEWNKATTEFYQRIAQQNLELIGDNFSRVSDQLKRFTSIKKPEDFLNLQKECFNEDMTAAIESMQKIMQTSMQNMEELTKLCGSLHDKSEKSIREHNTASNKTSERK